MIPVDSRWQSSTQSVMFRFYCMPPVWFTSSLGLSTFQERVSNTSADIFRSCFHKLHVIFEIFITLSDLCRRSFRTCILSDVYSYEECVCVIVGIIIVGPTVVDRRSSVLFILPVGKLASLPIKSGAKLLFSYVRCIFVHGH